MNIPKWVHIFEETKEENIEAKKYNIGILTNIEIVIMVIILGIQIYILINR